MPSSIEIKTRIVHRGQRALGPGKADLLEKIGSEGSISAAARAMGMSYSRAWALVEEMNDCFREPLVAAKTGGKKGGGAELTEFGADILGVYRQMQAKLEQDAARYFEEFSRQLK
jgi:molybdate transport system regulatory protein